MIRKDEIKKGKMMLRKVNIDTVFNTLTKDCWKNRIQYETILKNDSFLIIKLIGRRQKIIFKFHKADMVFIEDYEKFLGFIGNHNASKGIYICTGVFEGKVEKDLVVNFPLINNVKIEDGFHFIKRQLGLGGKAIEVFKSNKLSFLVYLPSI
jgi:hypothetical protein